jgi:hypothetical protein
MKKTTINVIMGLKVMDDLMHATGVFESFKRFGEHQVIEYEMQKSEPDLDFITRFKESAEKEGYIITAIWVGENPQVNLVDWSIKAISDGQKWSMLEPYLNHFGIQKQEKTI